MIEAIEAAVFAAVDAATTTPVYGHVPQNAAFPYVKVSPIEANRNDTDTENGFDGFFMVHVFSEYRGSKEALTIQKQIYDALHHTKPAVVDWGISTLYQEFVTIQQDNDTITRMGVQRFRIIFEPHAA